MEMMINSKILVKAGLFPDEKSVKQEAIRVLLQERPQIRIEWALYLYQNQDISLSKAAALANIPFYKMKEILIKRGIQPKLGPETIEEIYSDLNSIKKNSEKNNVL